jgi:replicative DNA helicase
MSSAWLEAECAVAGALLLDNTAVDRLDPALRVESFSDPICRQVFAEALRQIMANRPADVVTVFDGLRGAVTIAEIQGLASFVPSAGNLARYVELVLEHAQARALRAAAARIHELALNDAMPAQQRMDAAQAELSGLARHEGTDDGWVGLYDGLLQHIDVLEARREGRVTAWSTGLRDLDDITGGGLSPGELTIVGARPAMGKTALAQTIGLHMAQDRVVGFMSLEMGHTPLRDRQLASLGRVALSALKQPGRRELDYSRTLEGVEMARARRWFTKELRSPTINTVRAEARKLKRQHGLDLLIVDYLQLMSATDARQSRAYQLEECSRGLKSLAKELDVAVLAMAQVSRLVEQRADAMPMLSDLRDSGALEQDADNVAFLHRPAATNNALGAEWTHFARLAVCKQRQGQTGEIPLRYDGAFTRFGDWSGPAPKAQAQSSPRGYA